MLNELGEPGVTDNQEHFQKLMKEQSDLQPIVDAYREYKKNKETIQDSLSMLEEEKDEDMREMLKEELSEAKKNVEELEHELKILLLPKDPNDNKNVIVDLSKFPLTLETTPALIKFPLASIVTLIITVPC